MSQSPSWNGAAWNQLAWNGSIASSPAPPPTLIFADPDAGSLVANVADSDLAECDPDAGSLLLA